MMPFDLKKEVSALIDRIIRSLFFSVNIRCSWKGYPPMSYSEMKSLNEAWSVVLFWLAWRKLERLLFCFSIFFACSRVFGFCFINLSSSRIFLSFRVEVDLMSEPIFYFLLTMLPFKSKQCLIPALCLTWAVFAIKTREISSISSIFTVKMP